MMTNTANAPNTKRTRSRIPGPTSGVARFRQMFMNRSYSSNAAPAASSFDFAVAEKRTPRKRSPAGASPAPNTLTPPLSFETKPASSSDCGVMTLAFSHDARSPRLMTAYSVRKMTVERAFCDTPRRCGRRRKQGVCPPSKFGPLPPPERAVWPLPPLPDVLTMPLPWPRPTRVRFSFEPYAGLRSDSFTYLFSPQDLVHSLAALVCDVFNRSQPPQSCNRCLDDVDRIVRSE